MRRLIVLCLLTAPALAGPVAPANAVREDPIRAALHTWHRGERLAGFVPFLGAGLATGAAGGFLVASNGQPARGAGVTLIAFGAVESIAGLYLGFSSFGKESVREAALGTDRSAFVEGERARVARISGLVQPVLLGLWGATALGGGALAGAGALRNDDRLLGVGLGLAVQGLVLFLLDWAVLDRALAYDSVLRAQ